MAITKDDILEAVGQMSVMDLNDLVKAFEEKFGVSAAAMAVAGPAGGGGGGAAAAEEQSEFTVVLADVGANIDSQFLSTYKEIGYLIMDINKEVSEELTKQIANLPISIKTRTLS